MGTPRRCSRGEVDAVLGRPLLDAADTTTRDLLPLISGAHLPTGSPDAV